MEPLRRAGQSKYKILDQLGEGSLGVVYLARDAESGAEVALKMLKDRSAYGTPDLERVRRLLHHEATASARLSHPGIARFHDLIEDPENGELYLVMEHVSGSSLATLLGQPNPLPFDFVVKVVTQIAEVLDHVHGHGVVHRDIKPANVLITEAGRVKVTDFGLSELLGDDLAVDLQRAGSPNYMAPERVLGTGSDHRADLWALGVILYEMIARRPPFQGASVGELVQNIAVVEPVPLDAQGAFAAPGLQEVIDRALAKEPEERYQTGAELAEDLRAVQANQMTLSATLPASAIPTLDRQTAAEPELEPAPEPESSDDAETGGGSAETPAKEEPRPEWPERAAQLLRPVLAALRLPVVWIAGISAMVLLTALVLTLSDPGTAEDAAPAVDPPAAENGSPAQEQQLEYLAVLEEARRLIQAGEDRAAADLFAKAAALSPDGRRIQALRDQVRLQAEDEVAAEAELDLASWLLFAQADLSAGRLTDATASVRRALELDAGSREALQIESDIAEARQAAQEAARRRERPKPKVVVEMAPEPEPEPIRVAEPIQPPVVEPTPTFADLKIDFYSELPRGVLTIYRNDQQILRHPFRFVEKKGFLRSKGISGGFDQQVRLDKGPSEFRVYLSLPGRDTQVHRFQGTLPPGSIRALRLRVDREGRLDVRLH